MLILNVYSYEWDHHHHHHHTTTPPSDDNDNEHHVDGQGKVVARARDVSHLEPLGMFFLYFSLF